MHSMFYMASICLAVGSLSLVALLGPKSNRKIRWWMSDAIFLIAMALASGIIGMAAYALIGRGFH